MLQNKRLILSVVNWNHYKNNFQSFHVARHIATKLKIAKFKKLLDKLFVENIKYSYVRRILCGFVQNGWCSKGLLYILKFYSWFK